MEKIQGGICEILALSCRFGSFYVVLTLGVVAQRRTGFRVYREHWVVLYAAQALRLPFRRITPYVMFYFFSERSNTAPAGGLR